MHNYGVSQRWRFTQSARKHRVGRERARQVLADPAVRLDLPRKGGYAVLWLYLGADATGQVLEVGAIEQEDGTLLVIHVMDIRTKYRHRYEQALQESREVE